MKCLSVPCLDDRSRPETRDRKASRHKISTSDSHSDSVVESTAHKMTMNKSSQQGQPASQQMEATVWSLQSAGGSITAIPGPQSRYDPSGHTDLTGQPSSQQWSTEPV